MKLLQVTSLSATLLLSSTISLKVEAQNNANDERWFEMEVIIFSQLADKSALKEEFPEQIALPKYRRVIDLLTPYLNPEISTLKQQLPSCENPQYEASLLEQASKLPPYFAPRTLSDIENLLNESTDASGEINNDTTSANTESSIQNNIESNTGNNVLSNNAMPLQEQSIPNTAIDYSEQSSTTGIDNSSLDNRFEAQTENMIAPEISDEELALVALAEQTFTPFKFQYTRTDNVSLNNGNLCRIDESYFNELNNDDDVSYNSFAVKSVPRTIDAIEDVYSDTPYLLSKESLQLEDIVKQLRRSQNFRPLLHVGWRQAPKGRNKAIPVRLMAGDNLDFHYRNAQKQYQEALKFSQEQEALMTQLLLGNNDSTEPLNTLSLETSVDALNTANDDTLNNNNADSDSNLPASLADQQAQAERKLLQERVTSILQKIKNLPQDKAEILAQLDSPVVPISTQTPQSNLMLTPAPIKPAQPWYIDGFFKVHLNHYLYITADFNIMNMTLAEQATKALQIENTDKTLDIRPIRFEQNRRVISGEIHYFDHPYMGMIVQIRRHERPEPEIDQAELNVTEGSSPGQ